MNMSLVMSLIAPLSRDASNAVRVEALVYLTTSGGMAAKNPTGLSSFASGSDDNPHAVVFPASSQ
jgi:hypothetical protein